VLLLHAATPADAADKQIELIAEWGADTFVSDEDHLLAPADRHIVDEKEWAKLWTAWRPDRARTPPPMLNFNERLVIVVTSRDKITSVRAYLGDKGELTVQKVTSGMDADRRESGKGFYYRLAVIKREGVKTINGRPLKKADVSPALPADSTLQDLTERLKKLEQANAELRATVDRLQKDVEQLKKKQGPNP
jgi:hypothetical protein